MRAVDHHPPLPIDPFGPAVHAAAELHEERSAFAPLEHDIRDGKLLGGRRLRRRHLIQDCTNR